MKPWNTKILGRADGGKLTDSQDSFKFTYIEVDPRRENFSVSATFEVEDASASDFQSGYGIMTVDTIESPSDLSRHRNSLMVGRFRSSNWQCYSYGARVVGGYTDRDALPQDGRRRLDTSRVFSTDDFESAIVPGDHRSFRLEKTDQGFRATMITDSGEETIVFPGCDFLLKQNRRRIYVGLAVAGQIKLKITDLECHITPGRISHTPKDAIRHCVPDYPFDRSVLSRLTVRPVRDPMDLSIAILKAKPGSEIVLPDGVYRGGPYYIPEYISGEPGRPIVLRASHPGKAVIDGSFSDESVPGVILRGSHWVIDGLVFKDSLSAGLFVCGSDNLVRNCEAVGNRDTGILLCAFPGASKDSWPARNRIESCVSHDNCDRVRRNADGFGAKLSVGRGNVFYSCKAYHNIDDGFDLYTKSTIGPIKPVNLENCEASFNGWLTDEIRPSGDCRTGVGFKLGGEGQRVRHRVRDCVANDNARSGFDSNSNPDPVLSGCRASGNNVDFYIVPASNWFRGSLKRLRLLLKRL